jgi:hypothetical protein
MADSPQSIEHDHGPARVSVDVADADRFSVMVDRIRVQRQDGTPTAPSAPGVAAHVDYLGERLRVIETEPHEALVRSSAPVPAEGGRQYYELRFQGDGMTMERRQTGPDGITPVPFVLPKPTLERLVDDLGRLVGRDPAPEATASPLPGLDGDLFSGHQGCC